jgi:pilus assembly protein Flp/PilA
MNTHELWLRALARSQGSRFFRRLRSERGASAVEYGLMIAAIAAVIVVTVFAFGDNIKDVLFEDTCQEMVAGTGIGDCV